VYQRPLLRIKETEKKNMNFLINLFYPTTTLSDPTMGRTKTVQRAKKKKDDANDETNQKNNWVVQKVDASLDDFVALRTKLFKKNKNDHSLRDNSFFSFAAISYFWFEPNDDDSDLPTNCVRILRIFLQLQSRKYLEDVEKKLELTDLEEYRYDPLEEDDAAVDAKKAFHSVVGNCQKMAFAGVLRTKVFCFFVLFYFILLNFEV
jgi:hypothetical protein